MTYWTAEEYRAQACAHLTLRAVQKRLARWHANGRVRVVREVLPATSVAPPRARYLLDAADWRRATGIAAAA